MKRWWVRILVSYFFAGYAGIPVIFLVFVGRDVLSDYLREAGGNFLWHGAVWPLAVLINAGDFFRWRWAAEDYAICLACGAFCYTVLSRFAPKSYRSGLCPTCGYDLRATPDRCPECGTVIADHSTVSPKR